MCSVLAVMSVDVEAFFAHMPPDFQEEKKTTDLRVQKNIKKKHVCEDASCVHAHVCMFECACVMYVHVHRHQRSTPDAFLCYWHLVF